MGLRTEKYLNIPSLHQFPCRVTCKERQRGKAYLNVHPDVGKLNGGRQYMSFSPSFFPCKLALYTWQIYYLYSCLTQYQLPFSFPFHLLVLKCFPADWWATSSHSSAGRPFDSCSEEGEGQLPVVSVGVRLPPPASWPAPVGAPANRQSWTVALWKQTQEAINSS